MLRGFFKAARLEFNQIKESKLTLLLLFLVPVVLIIVFAVFGNGECTFVPPCKGMKSYDFLAPPVLPIVVLLITTQLTILRIVGEKSPYGTLDRDLLAISRGGMYLGKLLTNTVIGFIQCFLMFLTILIFGLKINGNPISVLLILLATAFMGLNMGLMFSVFSKNKEQAVQLVPYSVVALLVLSGVFIQFNDMPAVIRPIATISPLALSYNALSVTMLSWDAIAYKAVTTTRLFDAVWYLIGVVIWAFIFMILGLVKFKLEGR